jgi:hypothetical protein
MQLFGRKEESTAKKIKNKERKKKKSCLEGFSPLGWKLRKTTRNN